MRPLIFAAADEIFYNQFAKPLMRSAESCGMRVAVCNGGKLKTREDASCMRFRLLPDLLREHPAVFVIDVDSIINQPFEFPDWVDIGFFPRFDRLEPHMKTLMAGFYITDQAIGFAEEMKEAVSQKPTFWAEEQEIFHRLFEKHRDRYRWQFFGEELLSWRDGAPIYSPKGDRKFRKTFQARVARFA